MAHPCDAVSIRSLVAAAAEGLIAPTLIGPAGKVAAAAAEAGLDVSGFPFVDAPHSHAAAALAVAMARRGEAGLIVKGSLHTDELMHEVVNPAGGLTTERRVSHVYLMDVASYPRLLLITDAAVNIDPSLEDKRDIVQNAIELALAIGIETPRVAVLSAVETVSSKLKSTLDAAALCKMADRGQIRGGLVEGPLAFDNAVSVEAAEAKGLDGPVAGPSFILATPALESGNMLAKQLTFQAGARAAALVVGARVPIVLTSRADSELTHVTSCAVARLFVEAILAGAALRKVSA